MWYKHIGPQEILEMSQVSTIGWYIAGVLYHEYRRHMPDGSPDGFIPGEELYTRFFRAQGEPLRVYFQFHSWGTRYEARQVL